MKHGMHKLILTLMLTTASFCADAAEFRIEWIVPEYTQEGSRVPYLPPGAEVPRPSRPRDHMAPSIPGAARLTIKGNLVLEDLETFRAVAGELSHATAVVVELDSPGGLIAPAVAIGETIHERAWATAVLSRNCASACAFIWLAGNSRWYNDRAHIGFHGTRDLGSWERSEVGDAYIRNYLRRVRVPDHIIAYALSAPPTEMRWLSEADVKSLAFKETIDKDKWDEFWDVFVRAFTPRKGEAP